jgi:hypothetical protein
VVRSAGTRPPEKASSTTTSAVRGRSPRIPVRPSTARTLIRDPRRSGSRDRTKAVRKSSGSKTS